jgi:pimeloyl-ACP methyl ester carboxylesterase
MKFALATCCLAAAVSVQQSDLPPAPGTLVDIGGRRLHVMCAGPSSSPAVVLEAGASSFAIDWTLVQREIQATHRVCAYDRAGMGWSDPPSTTRPETSAQDLHALLAAAGVRPPFVLVGASRGGLLVRAYALEYPGEVAGFVFVDSSTEDRLFTMINGEAMAIASVTAEQLRSTFPREPVPIRKRAPQTGPPFDRLPPDLYRTRVQLDERLIAAMPATVPADVVAHAQESERALLARLMATRTAAPHPLGSRPAVVLTRGDEVNKDREASHAALAKLSSNSRHSVVPRAGHEIHLFEPSAVVQAIADVVEAVRTGARLPQR